MSLSYPKNVSTTVAPSGTSCYAGHWDTLQLGRTFDGFSPLETWMAPCKAMWASLQWGGLHIRARSILPNPVCKMCGVFRNRVLPPFLEGTRGNGNNLFCFGNLLSPPEKQGSFALGGVSACWYSLVLFCGSIATPKVIDITSVKPQTHTACIYYMQF